MQPGTSSMHGESLRRLDQASRGAPLVAHIIYRLDVGGLENGLVNLINRLPADDFRHAVICLTQYTKFRERIARSDVPVFALNKPPGNGISVHFALWRLLKQLNPQIVHTRNIAALECQVAAAAARVPVRVHSEHGLDIEELEGRNARRLPMRRMFKRFVHLQIGLSRELEQYLRESVRVQPARLAQIYNGVDTERFRPSDELRVRLPDPMFMQPDMIVIGTVGRMEPIKDPLTLARAFVRVVDAMPEMRHRLRLAMIGDGALRAAVTRCLDDAGLMKQAWLPGSLDSVHEILPGLDIFVLPSQSEGISNTILEAMACGLPIVATHVGGNPELVDHEQTGFLVPRGNPEAMASAITHYVREPRLRRQHGQRARQVALERFSLDAMVARYAETYRRLLNENRTHHSP